MKNLSQSGAPICEALTGFRANRVVPFDVPGHKGGRGTPELTTFLGQDCLKTDVNSMKPLDNLCHPVSVIRDAEMLAAEAFGAAQAFFMVNGTTSAVQAMIMSVCSAGDKIIMPRNVHRSAINALVVCGAIPVYIDPGIDAELGIPLGMNPDDVRLAMDAHPDAKAVLLNNPTYYGVCTDIRSVVNMAHAKGLYVLADEAHGTHFYFGDNLPMAAMHAGADMSSVSMHKTGGSLTQSSLLLCAQTVNHNYVRQVINLTQTTSASYLLLVSLDLARRNLVKNGKAMFSKAMELSEYARSEINQIGGYYAFSKELADSPYFSDFDAIKLSVNTLNIGLAGIEVYDLLRDEYGIQIEFGDIGNILAIISPGDRMLEIERLISALAEIKRLYSKSPVGMLKQEYMEPFVKMPPQKAFYGPKETVDIRNAQHRISAEFVMSYPPGIPILAPGELITPEILQYIHYAKEKGCLLTGPQSLDLQTLEVIREGV